MQQAHCSSVKNAKILFLLTFFSIICLPLFAQQEKLTISGYINDSYDGESLIGATVFVQDQQVGTTSNEYGFYSITLAPGEYVVEYRYLGYETVIKNINLTANQRIDLELGN